ncbi:RNA 3'-terminal phosphate cyclase-like [Lineus longissimus]|uniref:RNA 3'-terminal phosphate cyclase-like n=1 Tax=Lineus longissimus TaxID=88925 RepID=UPI002B4F4CDE
MATSLLEIDGSVLEGGGQILRISTALSCLTRQPITVYNIRASRSNPGLRPQHLKGLELVADICDGELKGGTVGSRLIQFFPSKIKPGNYSADTQTAGSICLLIQVAMPCAWFANSPVEMTVKGGTNAEMAPQIDYMTMVFKDVVKRFGIEFDCDIRRRGYFPKGGGEVFVSVQPVPFIKPIILTDRGEVCSITGRAFVAGVLPRKIASTMAREATNTIREIYPDVPINIEVVQESPHAAVGNGTGIIVVAETTTGCRLAGSALGKKNVRAEKVANDAANMLLNNLEHGGCVDEYLQDQLIILMALAKGKSTIQSGAITLHTETAIHIASQITNAKFVVKEVAGPAGSFLIECDGIGLVNSFL